MDSAEKILDRIYSDEKFANKISGNLFPTSISKKQGLFLKEKIQQLQPEVIIELGFGYGISALWIESGPYKPKKYIIVDNNRMSANYDIIYKYLKSQKHIYLEESQTSQQFLGNFQRRNLKADLIFIDADERFDSFVTDMYFAVRVLSKNGTIIVRNVWNPSIRKGLLFYLNNLPLKVEGLKHMDNLIIKKFPALGDLLLRFKLKPLDFCLLKLTGKDGREWNHFKPF